MSTQPLSELRRLLATEAPARGRVVRVLDGRVQVATSQGLATYQAGGALRVGQAVTLDRGTAYPQARAARVYAL
jgi:hypothetical protein